MQKRGLKLKISLTTEFDPFTENLIENIAFINNIKGTH